MKTMLKLFIRLWLLGMPFLLQAEGLKYQGFPLEKEPTFYVYTDGETPNYVPYRFTLSGSSDLRFAYYNSEHDVGQAFVEIEKQTLTELSDVIELSAKSSFKLVVNRYHPEASFKTTLKVGVFMGGASEPAHILNFVLYSNKPYRRVFAESVISTQCPYCVRMHPVLSEMSARFPDSFLGVAVHVKNGKKSDPMEVVGYGEFINYSGIPYMEYDREMTGVWVRPRASKQHSGISEERFLEQMGKKSFCGMTAGAYYTDASKTNIIVDGRIKFYEQKTTSAYRCAVVVKENNVRGDSPNYNQVNGVYGDNKEGLMGGYEKKPLEIAYTDMVYQAVARSIFPEYKGKAGMFPSSVAAGKSVKLSMNLPLPKTVMKKENLRLIMVVFDEKGRAVNAVEMPVLAENPVANEAIALPALRVESLRGGIVVSGVAGKQIRVYSIHGYLLEERVVNSDEAWIALPSGAAVVVTEGMKPKKVMIG